MYIYMLNLERDPNKLNSQSLVDMGLFFQLGSPSCCTATDCINYYHT